MSVANSPIRHCPLLLPNEHIALPAGWMYADGALCDVPIGATHTIHPAGRPFIQALARGTTLQGMYRIARREHITARDVQELLGILNILGALMPERNAQQQCHAIVIRIRHMLLGIIHSPFTWRKTATMSWVLIAVIRASWPVASAAICVAAFSGLGGLLSLTFCMWVCLAGIALFWGSLYLHELVHLWHIRRHHPTPVVLQRGMRLGIVHPALPARIEIITALAGPAAGLMSCLLISTVCLLVHHPVGALLSVCIGLFHLGSLLPWYGDGMALHRAWRGARHA